MTEQKQIKPKKKPKPDKPQQDQEDIFCREYITNFNATKAATLAKFKCPRQLGSRLLSRVDIQNKIKILLDKRKQKIEILEQQILNELRKIGFSDIRDFINHVTFENGKIKFDNEVDTSMIKKITIKHDAKKDKTSIAIDLFSKEKALELLMRHLNMLNDFNINNHFKSEVYNYLIPDNGRDPGIKRKTISIVKKDAKVSNSSQNRIKTD